MAKFVDDDGNEVKAVTAEQHALDNPEHYVLVVAEERASAVTGHRLLRVACQEPGCYWWNEEGYL